VIKGLPEFVRRRLDPAQRYGLRVTLFAVAVTLVAIPFGLLLREVVTDGPLTRLDTALARQLNELAATRPWAEPMLSAISFLGKPGWLAVVVGGPALWLLRDGERRLAIYLAVTTLAGGAVDTAVKVAVGRPRPEVDEPLAQAFGKSFPSGHSMSSTIAYGALLLVFLPLIPHRFRPWAFAGVAALVVAIGVSRLGLGVHYLSDVAGGWVLGLAWLAAATAAFSIWRVERGRPPVHVDEGVEPEETEQLARH
jgi:membrane-associated phospholipid phosphatase